MDNYPKLKHYRPIIVTPDFVTRFEAKVVRDDCMPNGCHIWIGATAGGYGRIHNVKKTVQASHASFVIYKGEIPYGMLICHTCDNPPCVNPAHLFLGTNSDNQLDAVAKGRQAMVAKTHCPKGHEFAGDNIRIRTDRPGRTCRACIRIASATFRDRQRLAL